MGPPCTTVKKDTFYMNLVFTHNGLEEGRLVQTAGATASKGGLDLKLRNLNINNINKFVKSNPQCM